MKKYFNIGVFYHKKNSFSVYVEMPVETDENIDDDVVVQYAIDNDMMDEEDANQVIYVEEMEEEDYKQTKGI